MITYLACHIYVVTNREIVPQSAGTIVRAATTQDVYDSSLLLGALKNGEVIPLSQFERVELALKYGGERQAIEIVRTVATCPSWSPSQHARAA